MNFKILLAGLLFALPASLFAASGTFTVYNGSTTGDLILVVDQTSTIKGSLTLAAGASGSLFVSGVANGDTFEAYEQNHVAIRSVNKYRFTGPTSGGTFTASLSVGAYATNALFPVTICNNNAFPVTAFWSSNGVQVAGAILMPGNCQTYTFSYDPSTNPQFNWGYNYSQPKVGQDGSGNYVLQQGTNINYSNSDYGTNQSAPTNLTSQYTQVFTNQMSYSIFTNSDINYGSPSTTAAHDDTLKAGFNALHNDLIINNDLLSSLYNKSNGASVTVFNTNLNNNFNTNFVSITNLVEAGSNVFDVSGLSNAVASFHLDNTNLLGKILDTNTGSSMRISGLDVVGAQFTNLDAAHAVVDPLVAPAEGQINDNISDADNLSTAAIPSGSLAGFTIAFAGYSLNLDPDSVLPGVTDWVYYLTELVILILFYLSASKLYMDAMANLGKLQVGRVPVLEGEILGNGGNLLGLLVHPFICLAIVTLWVGLLTVLLARFPSAGGIAVALGHVTSASGSGVSSAWYLLNKTIPIPLLLSLVGTRIALQFLIGNLILTAAAIMRFFLG